MRPILTVAVASLAIVITACQKQAETNAVITNDMMMNDTKTNDMSTAAGMALAPMAAKDFASTIAASDMFEIASGKIAKTMAGNEACRKFGAMLAADHTKSSAKLKNAAADASPPVTLPTTLPVDLQAKLDALKAVKGAAFDTLFLEQQKDGHSKALNALKSYSSSGDVVSLKSFANNAAPVVQAHLDMLNSMKM
ncbi:MAG: DUF4142 domain-containing protein [Sphingomonas bacterium]|nr:DUF4142 domain-containing protein [Sphingomonas bacterium]